MHHRLFQVPSPSPLTSACSLGRSVVSIVGRRAHEATDPNDGPIEPGSPVVSRDRVRLRRSADAPRPTRCRGGRLVRRRCLVPGGPTQGQHPGAKRPCCATGSAALCPAAPTRAVKRTVVRVRAPAGGVALTAQPLDGPDHERRTMDPKGMAPPGREIASTSASHASWRHPLRSSPFRAWVARAVVRGSQLRPGSGEQHR